MARYRGVNGVARECVKRYRGVNGVARQITKSYRGVNGVARQFFASNPVSKAILRLDYYSGTNYTIGANSIKQNTDGENSETIRFILDLYDIYGEVISYNKPTDIENLETFKLSVSTSYNVFSGSANWSCKVLGVNALSYESSGVYNWYGDGDFTVTESNFTSRYVEMQSSTQGHRTVTFNYLQINGEQIPLEISEY